MTRQVELDAPTRSRAAQRLHGLSIICGAIYLELKDLAGVLNAFGESPASNPVSPTLDRMRRAANFCGLWGVGNFLGGLRELAQGIENNPPLAVDRAQYIERVRALAAGVNDLGLHLRDMNAGVAVSYTALNEQFANVIRKARPQMLELTAEQAAPVMFMPAPPSLEVDAHWVPAKGASNEALLAALEPFLGNALPTAGLLRAVAAANPHHSLSGLFEVAASQQALCASQAFLPELTAEYRRLRQTLEGDLSMPPTPDAFVFSSLLYSLALDERDDHQVMELRRRYSLTRPKKSGQPGVSMHDIAKKFSAAMEKFKGAFTQAALSNVPSPVKKLSATLFNDAHRLDSPAFTTLATQLKNLTEEWDTSYQPGPEHWVQAAALLLLLEIAAKDWGNPDVQDDLAGLADLMAVTHQTYASSTMQRIAQHGAIQSACAAILKDANELKIAIEGALRSVGEVELSDAQALRLVENGGVRTRELMSSISGFAFCVNLPAASEMAERVAGIAMQPQSWVTSTGRGVIFDGISRISQFVGRLRPGSLIDIQMDEMGQFAQSTYAAEREPSAASAEVQPDVAAAESDREDEGANPEDVVFSETVIDENVDLAPEVEPRPDPSTATIEAAEPLEGTISLAVRDAPDPAFAEPVEIVAPVSVERTEEVGAAADGDDESDLMSFGEVAAEVAAPVVVDVQALRALFLAASEGQENALDTSDTELMRIMFEESEQCLSDIDAAFDLWKSGASQAQLTGTVAEARRHIHTLKGVCRTCGLMGVGATLHAMEDGLETMPDDGVSLGPVLSAYDESITGARREIESARRRFEHKDAGLPTAPAPLDEAAASDCIAEAQEVPAPNVENGLVLDLQQSGAEGGEARARDDEVASAAEATTEAEDSAAEIAAPAQGETVACTPEEPQVHASPPAPEHQAQVASAPAILPSPSLKPSVVAARSDVSVRVPVALAARVGDASGQVLMASRRSLEHMDRTMRLLREVESNLKRMAPALRELDILAAASIPSSSTGDAQGFDPLELDRYTALQELVRRLKEAFEDSVGSTNTLAESLSGAQGAEDERAQLSDELQRESSALMLVGVSTQRSRLERVVAKACTDAGKVAQLTVESSCRVPAAALDKLMPVFEHLLRNAVAHGIETPDGRSKAGKASVGHIVIGQPQSGIADGSVVRISVRDDGAGIDHERVLSIAQKRGLARRDETYPQEAIKEFLFMPGFSTATAVSELSGRGVGLDVVRAAVAALGGMVTVQSVASGGTEFILTLPTDSSSMSVVPVTSGGFKCLLPLTLVTRIVPISIGLDVELKPQSGKVAIAGVEYELIDFASRVPGVEVRSDLRPGRGHLVLMQESSTVKAVKVDAVGTQTRVIVRQLGPFVRDIPGMVAGTTLPGGEVGLVVNPLRLRDISGERKAEASAISQAKHVMVVDDSSTVRLVTSRFLKRQGFECSVACDGLEALQMLAKGIKPTGFLFDLEMPGMGGFELIAEIRRKPEFASTPIIVISSRTADKHRERARQLGATAYLAKPYEDAQLLDLLESLVGLPA